MICRCNRIVLPFSLGSECLVMERSEHTVPGNHAFSRNFGRAYLIEPFRSTASLLEFQHTYSSIHIPLLLATIPAYIFQHNIQHTYSSIHIPAYI